VSCSTQVLDHLEPRRCVVMRAIDPQAVHTLQKQVVDERVLLRGLARQGDHDANAAIRSCWRHVARYVHLRIARRVQRTIVIEKGSTDSHQLGGAVIAVFLRADRPRVIHDTQEKKPCASNN